MDRSIPSRSRRLQPDRDVGPCRPLAQSGPLRWIDSNRETDRVHAGHSFAYELTEFTNVLRLLVDGVRGEWTFTPDGDGTVIRWTYEFKPRRGRMAVVRSGLAPLWRHYMQASLEAAARVAERDAKAGTATNQLQIVDDPLA
jgi:hypothetical protein